jgi:integrase
MESKKFQLGMVALESVNGRLRLRWSYQGERYCLALGLPDTQINIVVAEGKAKIIEGDLATGNFDKTLDKYKPQSRKLSQVKVTEVFKQFAVHRGKAIFESSQVKYKALARSLQDFFADQTASSVDEAKADQFRLWLSQKLAPVTLKERLTLMNSCWQWATDHHIVTCNPWEEILGRVKVPPQQKARPFTKSEMQAIVAGFRSDRYYAYYGDFVEFLFATGCRTGEAIGLRWRHLSEDCSKVWIGESVSRGVRKATKTNRARQFRLTARLQALLLKRRPPDFQPDGLVFPSRRGKGALDDHNFRNRAWVSVLKRLGIEYRKPYTTRSSMISHSLAKGVSPVTIAEMVGHDPEVLFKHYAADIQGGLELPELLEGEE